MRFFRKIGKITIIGTKLGLNPTNWVENSDKSDFSLKQVYTKYNQIGDKFSPIVIKIWHFLKCHNNCISKSVNCSHIKISKGAINCSHAYCEEDYGKCCKHTLSSSNALLCLLVSQTHNY